MGKKEEEAGGREGGRVVEFPTECTRAGRAEKRRAAARATGDLYVAVHAFPRAVRLTIGAREEWLTPALAKRLSGALARIGAKAETLEDWEE